MAFYEPLHEQLATLTQTRIDRLNPGAWQSGHGCAVPYYSEYRDLLGSCGTSSRLEISTQSHSIYGNASRSRGVLGYQERFAAERYFLDENARDPDLARYIDSLLRHANGEGRIPVLKFCRSLGRVAWMRRQFPDAMHAVVIRDPVAQWRSARRQQAQSDNRYFLVGPLLVLARNAAHPLVAEACSRLNTRLPALPEDSSLAFDQEICWRHLAKLGWPDRYRSFLAFWTATSLSSLQAGEAGGAQTLMIDADDLLVSPPHREQVEQAILTRLGCALSLCPEQHLQRAREATSHDDDAEAHGARQTAHADAIGFLQEHASNLPDAAYAGIMGKLLTALDEPAHAVAPAAMRLSPEAALPGPCKRRKDWRRALYFALLRLSMPIRRIRGYAAGLWRRYINLK